MNNLKKETSHKSAGFTILEQALTLPIALVLIMGISDINSIFRARVSAQDGVAEALRCLTPTDGACTIANSASAATTYKYPVSMAENTEPPAPSASLNYLQSPTFATASYRVEVAKQPTIYVGNSFDNALDPRFANTDGSEYKPTSEISGSNIKSNNGSSVSGKTSSGIKLLGIINLGRINKLQLPCYLDESSFKECDNKVNIILQIAGKQDGTEAGSKGKALLYYGISDSGRAVPSSWTSLGGREFTADSNASFYTRGSDIDRIRGSIKDSIEEYTQTYNNIKVERGKYFWVKLNLEHVYGGEVAWKATNIKVFTNRTEERTLYDLRCSALEANMSNCVAKHPQTGATIPLTALTGVSSPSPLTACSLIPGINKKNSATSVALPENTAVEGNKLFSTSTDTAAFKAINGLKDFSCLKAFSKTFSNAEAAEFTTGNPGMAKYLQYETVAAANLNYQYMGTYTYEDIPAKCFNSKETVCKIGAPIIDRVTTGDAGKVIHNTDRAVQVARNLIQTTTPWANPLVQAVEKDGQFTVTATINVPLFAGKIFNWKNIDVTARDTGTWEGEFIK